ncbi:LPS assembly protein LptD, partial [Alphaproteobacteria bacterium]|nr:LPS assembly protein LptD [Alphaproteobacteria bacterium]
VIAKEIANEVYVNSNNISYDKKTNVINLGKNSLINYDSTSIKTDSGKIDINNKTIDIEGNFYLNYAGDIMKGNQLRADLNFNEGSAKNVNYIFNKNLKINSKILQKIDKKIIFKDSFITPCDLEGFFNCPTWSLKVKKTKYSIDEDYFEHFSTFLQVADKKIFYMPYFSHYGSKAPRQKGFLTPTVQLSNEVLGGNISVPYYYPISTQTDVKITPIIYFDQSLTRYFENELEFRHKIKEGDIKLTLNNFYDRRSQGQIDKGYSFDAEANLNLNKNNNIDIDLNYTSNISKYKSDNNSKAANLDSDITLNSYNFFNLNDLVITKISGSKALNTDINTSNPYELPSIRYINYINFKNNLTLNNDLKVDLISRNTSSNYLPMKIFRTNLMNSFQKNYNLYANYNLINKLKFNNSFYVVEEGNVDTNIISGNSHDMASYISSEVNRVLKVKNRARLKPRAKLILSNISKGNDLSLNDNSQSLSFNYNNLFQENKYFGSDKKESSSRIVLALEQNYKLKNDLDLNINYGRSYNFEKNKKFMLDIKQDTKLSDHLTEISFSYKDNEINYNSRHDKKNFDLKEDSISYQFNDSKNIFNLDKELTSNDSYINSKSSHFMTANYKRKINKNSNFSYKTEINLEDNNKVYSQDYGLEFYDECSKIKLSYIINNYSDGKLLQPNKTLSISYELDFISGLN